MSLKVSLDGNIKHRAVEHRVTSGWAIWTKTAKLRELNSWSAERG